MRKCCTILLVGVMLISCLEMKGAEWKWLRNKKKAKTEQTDTTVKKKPVSKYDKLLKKGTVQTAKGEFITIHKAGQKIYFEYPLKYMDREVLLGSTVKSTSNAFLVVLGYKGVNTLHLKFELRDSAVWVVQPNTAVVREANETLTDTKALDRAYTSTFYKRFPIAAYNNDSTAVVFEATNLLKNKDLNISSGMAGNTLTEVPEAFTFGGIKAFDDNISVEVTQNFNAVLRAVLSLPLGRVTATSTISILLLPEEKMKPRVLDTRVGVFKGYHPLGVLPYPKGNYTAKDGDEGKPFYLANRWRLEPVDQAAWERGKLVEVKKPIVWYLDDAFPIEWQAPIREGVLVWNRAFEKIGLKNVMQVRDFPTVEEDSAFDPDNLKYSCIRYVPTSIPNAMGPSWTDPVTGEILNASVIVWSDIAKLVNEWRFVQTAQVDERVRGTKKLPEEVMYEAMVYVSAHEIGHTLGLMHNMGASHAYPVDSLRSATFTAKYGTTPSIMDYARNNYVAQPEDKGVKLTPPDLGVYDEYVIKWLYSPVAGNKTMWEEKAIIEKWIDEKAGDPLYRYGAQQISNIYDPSALTEDLGDDPVKAGTYGIKNLKYILPHLEEWSGEEGDIARRESLYKQLVNQYQRYLVNVFYMIGGIYLTEVKDGTAGKPYEPVSREKQKRALKWLVKELRNCSWLDDPELAGKLRPTPRQSSQIQQIILAAMFKQMPKAVSIASHFAQYQRQPAYTITELFDDLYTEAFRPTLQGKTLSTMDRTFQHLLIGNVNLVVPPTSVQNKSLTLSMDDSKDKLSAYLMGDVRSIDSAFPELLEQFHFPFTETDGWCCRGKFVPHQFEDRNGFMSSFKNIAAENELAEAWLAILKKVNALAKSKMVNGPVQDRNHYELLYRETQKALKID